MINIEKYKNVLDQGLLLDHYSVLCRIRDGGELPKSKRIQGFINLLHKKGYLKEGALTEAGLLLIEKDTVVCEATATEVTTKTNVIIEEINPLFRVPERDVEYNRWATALHLKLQDRLKERTGKTQARGIINGTTYSFLPNVKDFSKVLLRTIMFYKLKDFDRIERHLLGYIDRKAKENNWFPILAYHIMKNGTSTMVTEMEESEDENTNDDTTVNI